VIAKIGTDGAYSRLTHTLTPTERANVFTMAIQSQQVTYDGAEHRPIATVPAPVHRATWPTALAVGALVLALDHGNFGAGILVVLWWLGWAVQR